jgi:hypothetical protein
MSSQQVFEDKVEYLCSCNGTAQVSHNSFTVKEHSEDSKMEMNSGAMSNPQVKLDPRASKYRGSSYLPVNAFPNKAQTIREEIVSNL